MLNLMYITNRPDVAMIAEAAGVNRIFVDMEYIGKADRQGGMDTVQSRHTLDDVRTVSAVLQTAELLVRVNPMHEASSHYGSSLEEIEGAIASGAKVLMLPFFKTVGEVEDFIDMVQGRAKVMPLIETPEAVACLDDLLSLDGIDELYVGLNDLSLGYGRKFMFDLLCDGTVENICHKIAEKGISYGFGGIAALGKGLLPAELIIAEHYRLGSTCAILSRSFCNADKLTHLGKIAKTFVEGIKAIREYEEQVNEHLRFFERNRSLIRVAVEKIHNQMRSKQG